MCSTSGVLNRAIVSVALLQIKDWKGKKFVVLPPYCDPHSTKSCTWDDDMVEKWTSAVHPRECGRTAALIILSKSYDIKCDSPESDAWNIVIETTCGLFEERSDEFREEDLCDLMLTISSRSYQLVVSVLQAMVNRDDVEEESVWLLSPTLFYSLISPTCTLCDDYFDIVMPQIKEIIPVSSKNWQASQLDDFVSFLIRKLSDFSNTSSAFFLSMAHLLLQLVNRNWSTLETVLGHDGDSLFALLKKCSLENVPAADDVSFRAAQFAKGKWIHLTLSDLYSALSSEVRSYFI